MLLFSQFTTFEVINKLNNKFQYFISFIADSLPARQAGLTL